MSQLTERGETFTLLKQLSVALNQLLSPLCEVVIHDLADPEHSIVHIDGGVSHRSIGGAATNLLLTRITDGQTDEDLYNYLTTLPGGRLMKSSTIFLRDETGAAYGAFCVNFEISSFASLQRTLSEFLDTETPEPIAELLSDDIHKTIQTIIAETVFELEQEMPLISRDDKVNLISRLDAKGVFRVKKAVPIIADQLGMSRATVYNYLTEARSDNSDPTK
jgi:predicted transcriptional regulator YheO